MSTQQEDIGTDSKEKVVLTAEEMDTILQQTTEANLSLEEGQNKQEGKSADSSKQQRSAQEDKSLHVLYGKDSNAPEEVSLSGVPWKNKGQDKTTIFLSVEFGGGLSSAVHVCSCITVCVCVCVCHSSMTSSALQKAKLGTRCAGQAF